MQLHDLLQGIYSDSIDNKFHDFDVSDICSDSRRVSKDCMFVALKGTQSHGSKFIDQAISSGARVVVGPIEFEFSSNSNVCYLGVADPESFLLQASLKFYDRPAEKLKNIGITGTNGKTTIAYLIEAVLQEAGFGVGVIGTVNYRVGLKKHPSFNTTPSFIETQKLMNGMVDEGAEYCVMEVSSHALDQGRVENINFGTAIFTNLTVDHLDYHKTKENYFLAKSRLFSNLREDAFAITNVDDVYGRKIKSKTAAQVITFGIDSKADVMAKDIHTNIDGTRFKLLYHGEEALIRTCLVGKYNVYNMLAAAAACLVDGIDMAIIKAALESVKGVPGRLERIDLQQSFSIFVDYAHTQDALENVLGSIRNISDANIILVFGCGGDRDKSKRPAMGKVASRMANYSIITSDNPRSEVPEKIISEVVDGFEGDSYEIEIDREQAICKALDMADDGDIVLIAGKGHETYQIFKDQTIKFDEKQIIRNYILC